MSKFSENLEILLSRIDIISEYKSWGCRFTKDSPRPSGWIPCHAIGRVDNKPSGAVNAITGVYKDSGRVGTVLSFFSAASAFGGFPSAKDAIRHYAKLHGMSRQFNARTKITLPEDKIDRVASSAPAMLSGFLNRFPTITYEGTVRGGCYLARYPAKSHKPQYVLAIPAYPASNPDAAPCGIAIMSASGGQIELYRGKDIPPESMDKLTIAGSKSGFIGQECLSRLDQIQTIWKTEGLTDFLTLQSFVPKDGEHGVITTLAGATETTPFIEGTGIFSGKNVIVVHDSDEAGQSGAEFICHSVFKVARTVKNVLLSNEIKASKGYDLRDFFSECIVAGLDPFSELQSLADKTSEFQPLSNMGGDNPSSTKSSISVSQAIHDHDNVSDDNSGDHIESKSVPSQPNQIRSPGATKQKRQQKTQLERAAELSLLRFGCTVIGEDAETDAIICHSEDNSKVVRFPNIDRVGYSRLIQAFGPRVMSTVSPTETGEAGILSVSSVKAYISLLASNRKIESNTLLGKGLWLIEGGLLLVNGTHWVSIEPSDDETGELQVLSGNTPVYRGHQLDLHTGASEVIKEERLHEIINDCLKKPSTPADTFKELVNIFDLWGNFQQKNDSLILAAMCIASILEHCWKFRPSVSIVGPSASGKSTLVSQVIPAIFGNLALPVSDVTVAGIKQNVKNQNVILLIDEFESAPSRDAILRAIRSITTGTVSLRGTSDQGGAQFQLHHVVWTAAIESGRTEEADDNRSIEITLTRVPEGSQLKIPEEKRLRNLGERILASSMVAYRSILDMYYYSLDHNRYGRSGDVYAVPASIICGLLGMPKSDCLAMIDEFVNLRAKNPEDIDEDKVLFRILAHTVTCAKGYKTSLARLVSISPVELPMDVDKEDELARLGIAILPGDFVFMHPQTVAEAVRMANGKGFNLRQILLRLPGVQESREVVLGRRMRGVLIPPSYFSNIDSGRFIDGDSGDNDEDDDQIDSNREILTGWGPIPLGKIEEVEFEDEK